MSINVASDFELSKSLRCYLVLNLIMIVALAASVITVRKIVNIGYFSFPCCNIIFSFLTFPITDIISEILGKAYAKVTVYISFLSQALFVLLIQTSIYLPHPDFWTDQMLYQSILGSGPGILLASMVAFIISQIWDVIIFAKLKKITKGKYLWLRNNVSMITSQMINSALFISIAFYSVHSISSLFIGSIFLKIMIALLDTPLVYFGVSFIHKYLDKQTLAYTSDE